METMLSIVGAAVGIAGLVLSILGVAIGIIGFIYAVKTNHEKARLEQHIKADLRSLAGNIEQISSSSAWAHNHLQEIQKCTLKLGQNQDVNEILRHTQDGAGDSIAVQRMIRNLLNQVLALQEGIFGTRTITHTEKTEQG